LTSEKDKRGQTPFANKESRLAGFYGKITDAGISQAARRLQKKREEEDDELNKLLLELKRRVDLLNVET
jgi:hypothetical protein